MPKSGKNSETDTLRRKVAARIDKRCEMLGITRTQFAADLSIDPKTLQKYLRGDAAIPVDLWERMARLLKCDTDFLFAELSDTPREPVFRVLENQHAVLSKRLQLLLAAKKSLVIYRPYTGVCRHVFQSEFDHALDMRMCNRTLKLRYIQDYTEWRSTVADCESPHPQWPEFKEFFARFVPWEEGGADVELRLLFSSFQIDLIDAKDGLLVLGSREPPLAISFDIFDEEQTIVEWNPPKYNMPEEAAGFSRPAMWCSGKIVDSLLREYWLPLVNKSIRVHEDNARELLENFCVVRSVKNLTDEEVRSLWRQQLADIRSTVDIT